MTKDEALKLALDELIHASSYCNTYDAIDAIKEALAQPEQEPVAWGFRHHDGAIYDCISPEAHADCEGEYTVPLYTAPPKRPWVGLTDEQREACTQSPFTEDNYDEIEAKLKELNT